MLTIKKNKALVLVTIGFWLFTILYTYSYLTEHDFLHLNRWIGNLFEPIYSKWFGEKL
ncbi:hypothetical protein [Fictibacillus macauensis]|uniref:hypothetical protein n=1 Tax=Fictibacillus macauensis TaxID=245160 RepID=UPI0003114D0A|nr:hypothetical protein [Fictibacillus macauensis]